MRRFIFWLFILLLPACFAAGPAYAGTCTSPAGNEADIIYNGTYHTYQFCDGTSWNSFSGSGAAGSMTLLSSQTASSSANIQFTGLSSSYDTLYISCTGLMVGTNNSTMLFYVGEGGGPTWETSAHYQTSGWYNSQSRGALGAAEAANTTDAITLVATANWYPVSLKMWIDNVGSSTLYKNMWFEISQLNTTNGGYYNLQFGAEWTNDTNPVTGMQLTVNTGVITSGTCNLYGIN